VAERPKGPRSGAAARSGPSGDPIPDEQRKRPILKTTVARETADYLAHLSATEGASQGQLVDEAVRLLARERASRG
jgi:hypothetical protein